MAQATVRPPHVQSGFAPAPGSPGTGPSTGARHDVARRIRSNRLKRWHFIALEPGICRVSRKGTGTTQKADGQIHSAPPRTDVRCAGLDPASSVNRSGTVPLLSVPKYFGSQCSYPTSRGNTMNKMLAAVLAGLFAAVTASSIVVAAEPKKDDAKKTEKKAEKK